MRTVRERRRPSVFYLDTSAILRALVETGRTPTIDQTLAGATDLITSRLTTVEAARAVLRLRHAGTLRDDTISSLRSDLSALWTRCDIWELTPTVCDTAATVASGRPLRALDALHLATYVLVRQRFPDVEFVTADRRLAEAVEAV